MEYAKKNFINEMTLSKMNLASLLYVDSVRLLKCDKVVSQFVKQRESESKKSRSKIISFHAFSIYSIESTSLEYIVLHNDNKMIVQWY